MYVQHTHGTLCYTEEDGIIMTTPDPLKEEYQNKTLKLSNNVIVFR